MLLSIAIIAYNEERYIGDAIISAKPIADEIVVLLDPRTTDRTTEICRKHGATIIMSPFVSFPDQRNRALHESQGEWVLFLDADERITPALQHEIAMLKQAWHTSPDAVTGYWIPRHNAYWGRVLQGGGWYPDHQLRLLKRAHAHYDPERVVHELVVLAGESGYLHEHLYHINIESWAELRRKQANYARKEAETLYRNGVRFKPQNIILQPLRAIWRRWWTWHGYRDGWLGIMLALVMGWYEAVMYWHLKNITQRVPA